MKSNGIEKNIANIFSRNYVRHFSGISLDELPIKKEIRDIFGNVKSIYVFYLPYSKGLLDLKKRRAFSAKNSNNTLYLNSIFLRSLKIIYTEIERISLDICNYLDTMGNTSLPVPVRCIPGEEDVLPFSLIRIAQYAGLGGEGENKCLVTSEAGPRIILGAIVTSYNSKRKTEQIDPCIHCFKCADICPTGALSRAREKIYFWEKCNMCSLCEIVCPVGQDGRRRMHVCASDTVPNEVKE